ncbi:hypothetical protein [uncultured Streptomyces sp.]|uniref:hypothetical protein n=1 Tax=uncultured Streptomyces sp. TaxID=174707 RepID=UPI0026030440|nr:hypothetical protein [uncultured Streptomyces sp.]
MVEGEKGSRQANGPSEAVPRQRRSAVGGAEGDEAMPSGDLARLLAAVGILLGGHAPGDLVVLPREDVERREFAAYGKGWRDAMAQYDEVAARVGSLPAEGGDRTPGQAAVIPFRRRGTSRVRGVAPRDAGTAGEVPGPQGPADRAPAEHVVAVPDAADSVRVNPEPADPDPVAAAPNAPGRAAPAPAAYEAPEPAVGEPAPTAATPAAEPGPGDRAPAPDDPAAEPGPPAPEPGPPAPEPGPPAPEPGPTTSEPTPTPEAPSSPAPVFAPKNRRSKVPTIPRLIRAPKKGRPQGG